MSSVQEAALLGERETMHSPDHVAIVQKLLSKD
jgi:hypothetical protein